MSWVPLARSLFEGVQHNLLQSGHVWSLQMQPLLILQPLPFDPLPPLPLHPHLGHLSPLRTSMEQLQHMRADFGSRLDHLSDEMCQMNIKISCIACR